MTFMLVCSHKPKLIEIRLRFTLKGSMTFQFFSLNVSLFSLCVTVTPSLRWRTPRLAFSTAQRLANAVVNQSGERHLLSSWERTGSVHLDFTRRSVHAYKTARLPRCSPHTRLWACYGGDLSPSSSPFRCSSNLSKPRLSFLSMAFRGVICIQQRNS